MIFELLSVLKLLMISVLHGWVSYIFAVLSLTGYLRKIYSYGFTNQIKPRVMYGEPVKDNFRWKLLENFSSWFSPFSIFLYGKYTGRTWWLDNSVVELVGGFNFCIVIDSILVCGYKYPFYLGDCAHLIRKSIVKFKPKLLALVHVTSALLFLTASMAPSKKADCAFHSF